MGYSDEYFPPLCNCCSLSWWDFTTTEAKVKTRDLFVHVFFNIFCRIYCVLELLLNDSLAHPECTSPPFSFPLSSCINSAETWEQSESCRGKFKCMRSLLLAVGTQHRHLWQLTSGMSGICGIWFVALNRKAWDMLISPFCRYCTHFQTLLVQVFLRLLILFVLSLSPPMYRNQGFCGCEVLK